MVRRITEHGWTVGAAAGAAGLSERQTYRWLARYRTGGTAALVNRRSALKRCQHQVPGERERPRELLHIDTKKLGRIAALGHRITGNRRDRRRGAGWEAVHVCIDDASRLAYSEVLPDERKTSAVRFLERAVAWFAGQGARGGGEAGSSGS